MDGGTQSNLVKGRSSVGVRHPRHRQKKQAVGSCKTTIENQHQFMSNLAVFNKTINGERTQEYLTSVLRDKKESFVTSLVSVVANNAQLQACEPLTIMYAAMKATALGLPIDPNLGFAYVIPYKNKGRDEAQFQMGTKGFLQLAMRSGQFSNINADAVYEGEISKINRKTGDIELDGQRTSDKVVGYFAYFRLTNGFEKTLYMSREEIEAHGKRFSRAFNFGPWKTDFDAMAKKTVLKALLSKYAPMSIEMQSAVKADQAIYRDASLTEDYVDNAETEPKVDDQTAKAILESSDKVLKKVDAALKRQKSAEAAQEVEDASGPLGEKGDTDYIVPEEVVPNDDDVADKLFE